MTNLIELIQIAREEMVVRKEALKALNDVNTQRMEFKETDLYETIVLRAVVSMDGETVGADILILDEDKEVFDIEIYNLDTGMTHFTDEVKGVEALKLYFKSIDNVLTAKANGVY